MIRWVLSMAHCRTQHEHISQYLSYFHACIIIYYIYNECASPLFPIRNHNGKYNNIGNNNNSNNNYDNENNNNNNSSTSSSSNPHVPLPNVQSYLEYIYVDRFIQCIFAALQQTLYGLYIYTMMTMVAKKASCVMMMV